MAVPFIPSGLYLILIVARLAVIFISDISRKGNKGLFVAFLSKSITFLPNFVNEAQLALLSLIATYFGFLPRERIAAISVNQ